MRVLHTSDWHLGQSFFGESRLAEHRAFLDFLVNRCRAESVDVLLVSGDVFDTLNPPAEAEEAWYSFLARLARESAGTRLHVLSGNHDSPARLCAPRAVVRALGVEVHERLHFAEGSCTRLDPARHLRLVTKQGNEGKEGCVLGVVPFVRPSEVPGEFGPEGNKPLHTFLTALFAGLRADSARLHPGVPLILAGHLFASGGSVSEHSERRIQRGNLDALPLDAFGAAVHEDDACRYVALGHLHRAQVLQKGDATSPHVRYAGSPLPLSFTEVDYPHQVVLVDIDGNAATCSVRELRVPRVRRLLRVPADHAPADAVMEALHALAPAEPGEIPPLVEARVSLRGPVSTLRPALEAVLREKGMRLLQLSLQRELSAEGPADGILGEESATSVRRTLQDFSVLEIFERCHVADFGTAPEKDLTELFLECLEAAAADEGGPGEGAHAVPASTAAVVNP